MGLAWSYFFLSAQRGFGLFGERSRQTCTELQLEVAQSSKGGLRFATLF